MPNVWVFFYSYFPFLGPTADKTCFANLEELKMQHKIMHHSSVVSFLQSVMSPVQALKLWFWVCDTGFGKLYRFYLETHLSMSP